ncbi:hypothetical protein K1719_023897 [Acacia pycnantha]|nr:hypothetical protein K1719_023897 [Acacia pycnantha]
MIVYEGISVVCVECRRLGHRSGKCATVQSEIGEKHLSRNVAEVWRKVGKKGSSVQEVSDAPKVGALVLTEPPQQVVGEGSMQALEVRNSLGNGFMVVDASLGQEVADVAQINLQSVESHKTLGSEQVEGESRLDHKVRDEVCDVENVVPNVKCLQKGPVTRDHGIDDGSDLADRGIYHTSHGASQNVGLGGEVSSCKVEEANFEEIKDQINSAQTGGGRRVVEASGSSMKNGDKRRRGRPIGSKKAKSKVAISGIASQVRDSHVPSPQLL